LLGHRQLVVRLVVHERETAAKPRHSIAEKSLAVVAPALGDGLDDDGSIEAIVQSATFGG
jgi:hypothetical protein